MSFRWRLALVLVGVFLAVTVVGLWLLRSFWQHRERQSSVERLVMAAHEVMAELEGSGTRTEAELQGIVQRLGSLMGGRVTLIAPDGRVLADSRVPVAHLPLLENHLHRPEVAAALAQGRGVHQRQSVTTGVSTLYVAIRGEVRGEPLVVRTATELKPWSWPWAPLVGLLVGAITVGVLGARMVTQYQARAARHLAEWCDLPPAADLSSLAIEADRRFRELKEQLSRELEACQQAWKQVSEGIVLLDRSLVIRFANAAARELLGPLPLGAYFWEAVRDPSVLAMVEEHHEAGSTRGGEVQLGGRVLAVSVVVLDHPLLVYAVLVRDVEPQRRFEATRRVFVADLAHELRTPLAVMGAALEELETEGVQGATVEMLRRQLQRLTRFARDLEELARIESGAVELAFERFDLRMLAEEVAGDLAAFAHKREVSVKVSGEPVQVVSDRFRLSQVLANLLDNGIRYNRPGGSVEMRITSHQETVAIDVEDTGPGIPKGDMALVFQRFYRVRGHQEEGSGLGLAIVKHLVEKLGGRVEVTSVLGNGTKFTVTLPTTPPTGEPPAPSGL